jgi:hypothetical protein
MQGMGGIGKTMLARALCYDWVVQQAFLDGIFWFAIGKESQLSFAELLEITYSRRSFGFSTSLVFKRICPVF